MEPSPPTPEERKVAFWAHLAPGIIDIVCFVTMLCWLPPLIIYLTKRDDSAFIGFHALQSLLFQCVVLVINVVFMLMFLVGFCFVLPLGLLINVGAFVYALIVGLRAQSGEWFEYLLLGELARKTVLGPPSGGATPA